MPVAVNHTRLWVMFISALLAIYILYNVWSKMIPESQRRAHEGFSSRLTHVLANQSHMPLMYYCIKGSYHSAFDGTQMSLAALDAVLKSGCRFLDFEIFFVKNPETNENPESNK